MNRLCLFIAGAAITATIAVDLGVAPALFSASRTVSWPAYGGGPAGDRYSPLKQINRTNAKNLQVAWTYDADDGPGASQTQPIMVNGVLFTITPKHKIVALDAMTGAVRWRFDSGLEGRGPNRGVTYWADGKEQRIFAAVQSFLYALDFKTGKPIPSFGVDGRLDLREGLGRDAAKLSFILTTPGIIFKDTIIVGGRTPEALPSPPGDVRSFDVRSGKLRWNFHTIPRPGGFGYDTWPKDAWTYTGSVNNWAGMALDVKRGIVYVPTGSAATDFYGADRLGDNLFANTLLALDAETGKRIWHFQAVKHDIWDRDFPAPPTLVMVRHEGKMVDAVAQVSKQGWLYLFDRVTGVPLFPIENTSYPASEVPGEVASATQPRPAKPLPFARQVLTADILSQRTPEIHEWALKRFQDFRSGGQFVPLGLGKETVVFPGFDGGAEWGGQAFDPETGLYYVNANDLAWTGGLAPNQAGASTRQLYLRNCGTCHGENLTGAPPQIPALDKLQGVRDAQQITRITRIIREGAGRMPSFPGLDTQAVAGIVEYVLSGQSKELEAPAGPATQPYRFTGYHKFLDPDGYPAVAPPWGTLNAINLNTGEYAWKIPLGEYPELAEKGMNNTGTENYGGPIVTAGGLVFIGATNFDSKFRAFDKLTGALLWETKLPLAGNTTPITYEIDGRQYVVIYATGGKDGRGAKSGGIVIAFALPQKSRDGRTR